MSKEETREVILKAALTLFKERGFETVSIRDVTKLADVNLASVNYHFRNKEGLILEATSRILDPMNLKRIELLEHTITKHGGIENTPIRDIFYSFLQPLFVSKNDETDHILLAKLGAKHTSDPDAKFSDKTQQIYKELLISYVKAIFVKFPDLAPDEIRRRLVFTSGAALQYIMLGPMAASLTGEEDATPREEILNKILHFTLHGFNFDQKQ